MFEHQITIKERSKTTGALMNRFQYLYRGSWGLILLAAVCGVIGGSSGGGLIFLITNGVSEAEKPLSFIVIFLAVSVTYVLARTYSTIVLTQLAQTAMFRLRLDLSRNLLATPLEKLQALGKHGMLAISQMRCVFSVLSASDD